MSEGNFATLFDYSLLFLSYFGGKDENTYLLQLSKVALQGFAGFYNTELELYILLNRKGFQMVPENPTLEQLEAEFYKDQFATHAAHCRIIEGKKGYAVCEMPIETIHRNGMGNVMGGAIFTLADFALAIAGNVGQPFLSLTPLISSAQAKEPSLLQLLAATKLEVDSPFSQ